MPRVANDRNGRYIERQSRQHWSRLTDVDRQHLDPRPLVDSLEVPLTSTLAWSQLSRRLYHEGCVGDASYAAVPQLVRFAMTKESYPWQISELIGHIEIARVTDRQSPLLPHWLKHDYMKALELLATHSLVAIARTKHFDQLRTMLCMIALWKGLPVHAIALLEYSSKELGGFLLVEDGEA